MFPGVQMDSTTCDFIQKFQTINLLHLKMSLAPSNVTCFKYIDIMMALCTFSKKKLLQFQICTVGGDYYLKKKKNPSAHWGRFIKSGVVAQ